MYDSFLIDMAFFAFRICVAGIFISHSLQKIIKGKFPFKKHREVNVLIGLFEMTGALFIASGLLIKIAAGAMACLMLGAIFFHKAVRRDKLKGGWSTALLLFFALILLLLTGGGNWRIIF